jgi:hypothetical protein
MAVHAISSKRNQLEEVRGVRGQALASTGLRRRVKPLLETDRNQNRYWLRQNRSELRDRHRGPF